MSVKYLFSFIPAISLVGLQGAYPSLHTYVAGWSIFSFSSIYCIWNIDYMQFITKLLHSAGIVGFGSVV